MLSIYLAVIGIFLLIFGCFIVKDIVIRRRSRDKNAYKLSQSLTAYAFLAPAIILMAIFVILPIVFSLFYAFTDYYLLRPNYLAVTWFNNFRDIFTNFRQKGDMYYAVFNTLQFVLYVTPLQIGLSLALALLVNKKRKGNAVFKVLFFAPVVISLAVTSFLWVRILSPDANGLLNSFLMKMGFKRQDFLLNEKQSMFYIILISAWQGAGYQMLIFLSGLKNINSELYEAASLDGAGKFRQFLSVTLPGLRSVMAFVVVTVFIGACKIMVQPMLMTGKTNYTLTLSYLMYIQGYERRWVGYSSAIALIMTLVIGLATYVQRRLLREE